jgi:hypothetical protein
MPSNGTCANKPGSIPSMEMGIWNADAIERQFAHVEANAVRRTYTRGQYWDERVRMMQHWPDYIDSLRNGTKVLRPNFRQAALG